MLFTATLRIVVSAKSRPTYHYRFTLIIIKNAIFREIETMVLEKSRPTYRHRFTGMIKKILFTATLRIVVLEKSRPTYHYRFTLIIKNAIFREIEMMILEKSRPTYRYRFTGMIKKCHLPPYLIKNYSPGEIKTHLSLWTCCYNHKNVIFCQIIIVVLEKSRPT